jgi:hypothetical protein
MLRLLEAQASTVCASLVAVVLIVEVAVSTIVAALLAPGCEILDEPAFGEVVPVGGV